MTMIRTCSCVVIFCAALLSIPSGMVLRASEFRSITTEDVASLELWSWTNPELDVTAISGDGSTIAGRIWNTGVIYDCAKNICGVNPFTWSLNDSSARSMIVDPIPLHLESYTGYASPVLATGLSHDGKNTLGVSEHGYLESAIFNGTQPTLLRPSINPQESLWAGGISSDGKTVVGNVGAQPIRWREQGGLQPITGLPNNFSFSADVVSGDGEVVVLNGQPSVVEVPQVFPPGAGGNAFRWTATTGLTELPQLPGDDYSHGTAASFDGETIVGSSVSYSSPFAYENRAMRWSAGVPAQLDAPAGFSYSMAEDVSADGKIVVGSASNQTEHWPFELIPDPQADWFNFGTPPPTTERAMIWNADGHVFDMKLFLETRYGLGAQLAGWLLIDATAISDDGRVIAGRGISPEGKSAIWIAQVTVPEPSTLVVAVAGIVLLAALNCRTRRCCAVHG